MSKFTHLNRLHLISPISLEFLLAKRARASFLCTKMELRVCAQSRGYLSERKKLGRKFENPGSSEVKMEIKEKSFPDSGLSVFQMRLPSDTRFGGP